MQATVIVAIVTLLAAASAGAAEDKKESTAMSSPSPTANAKSAPAEPTIHTTANLKWGEAPPRLPGGGKITVLDGDPTKPGSFTVRLKMPAGYKIMPHTHPAAERVTVISGKVSIAMGDRLEESAGREMNPGDFVVLPKGSQHSAWATEEAVIQLQSEGPFEMTYKNPADDPRKEKK